MRSTTHVLTGHLHRTGYSHPGTTWRRTAQVTGAVTITGTLAQLTATGTLPPILTTALATAALLIVAICRALRHAARHADTILAEQLHPQAPTRDARQVRRDSDNDGAVSPTTGRHRAS